MQQETNRVQQQQTARLLEVQQQALTTQQETKRLLLAQAKPGQDEIQELAKKIDIGRCTTRMGEERRIQASHYLQKMTDTMTLNSGREY